MQRIDGPTRSATLPTPAGTGTGSSSPGYFQRGDPLAGTPPTTLDVDWANGVQEELVNVIVAGGGTPDKANRAQLLAALMALFVAKGGGQDIHVDTGEFSLPLGGGVILKAGTISGAYAEGPLSHTFSVPFPTQCLVVVPVAINASGSTTRDIWAQRQSKSASGFTVMLQLGGGGTTNSIDGIDWIAIGN